MTEAKDKEKDKPEKESEKDTESKKNIVIKETEEDIVLGTGFTGDPEDFKEEIKREAEKGGVFTKYIAPLLFVIIVAGVSGLATYYYSKPERSIDSEVKVEDKIQTPPTVEDTPQEGTTPTPAAQVQTPAATEKKEISYTVQEGDTMSGIANKYDMTSTELATYNSLSDVNALHIGQVLKIPVK